MTDPVEPSYAEKALERLRRLAKGNGIAPDKIVLEGKEEQTVHLSAKMMVSPKLDIQVNQYPGLARDKDSKSFPDVAAMREEVAKQKSEFEAGMDWLAPVIEEVKRAPGEGWGLDGATISIPSHRVVYAASENCPSCGGAGALQCPQCHGQQKLPCSVCQGEGKELCLNCNATGHDPLNPQKECYLCKGTRYMVCRQCQGLQWMPCSACMGRGSSPCGTCRGSGKISEEIRTTGTATAEFRLDRTSDIPSGFLRGLDKLGIPNLVKGYGKISMSPPVPNDEDKNAARTLIYKAEVPYTEIRLKIADKPTALVSLFGLKGAMLGCPAFLDEGTQMARETLRRATTQTGALAGAMKCRAVFEALALEMGGRGQLREMKKIYPVGLSEKAMREILSDGAKALALQTRKRRIAAAVVSFIAGSGLIGGYFLSDIPFQLFARYSAQVATLTGLVPLGLGLGLTWFLIGAAANSALKRLFKGKIVARRRRIGKIGYGLMAGLFAVYILCVLFLRSYAG
jgi:hypothetical protein